MPGEFVGLRAVEWSHDTTGHITVFNTDTLLSRTDPQFDELADLYAWLIDDNRHKFIIWRLVLGLDRSPARARTFVAPRRSMLGTHVVGPNASTLRFHHTPRKERPGPSRRRCPWR